MNTLCTTLKHLWPGYILSWSYIFEPSLWNFLHWALSRLMFWSRPKHLIYHRGPTIFSQGCKRSNNHWNSFYVPLWLLQDSTCISLEDSYMAKELLVFGDAFEVGVVEFVHDVALVKELKWLIKLVQAFLYQWADIEFELIHTATALYKIDAFAIALDFTNSTFWRKAV